MSGLFGGGGGGNTRTGVPGRVPSGGMKHATDDGATYLTKYDKDRAKSRIDVINEFNAEMERYNRDYADWSDTTDGTNYGPGPTKPEHLTDKEIEAKMRGRVSQSAVSGTTASMPELNIRQKRAAATRKAGGRKSTILSNNGA